MPGVMPASSLYRIRPANSTGIWLIQKKIFPVLCKRRIALINALRVQLSAGWACFLAFPGGTGTLEEITEVISKVSLRQLDAPCILYNLGGYYNSLQALLQHMNEKGLSTPERQKGIYFAEKLAQIQQILGDAT